MKYTKGISCGRGHHDYKVTKSASTYYIAVCRKCGSSKTKYRKFNPKTGSFYYHPVGVD